MAAVDFFLKIEGVDGESVDDKHKGEIEISSFSWGLSQSGSFGTGGGGGAGKASFQDLHFSTTVSKASPMLMLACASGQHFKKATLTCRKAGGEQRSAGEFLYVKMEDVLVSSYQSGSHSLDSGFSNLGGDGLPTDQFSLNFTKIEYDYVSQSADGKPGAVTAASWDLAQGKKA